MRLTRSEDSTVLHVPTRFTFDLNEEFKEALAQVSGPLVVDLSATQYVDSFALGLLLIARDYLGSITLSNPKGIVKETLLIANFDKLFTIV